MRALACSQSLSTNSEFLRSRIALCDRVDASHACIRLESDRFIVEMEADNHSDISSRRADGSWATGCSIALSMEDGSFNAAANRRACSPQRRTKAAVNALERLALDCASPNLHPRKVAHSVVKVGPPRRCTILSEVVAIGRSCFLTEAYAAEMEGMPTVLRPIPRTKRAHASTVSTSP